MLKTLWGSETGNVCFLGGPNVHELVGIAVILTFRD
jgi:hypothetical protein